MAYKGFFHPQNPKKYIGDATKIVYRSSWECKFMSRLDRDPNVISWASEELFIPYISPIDNRGHRYFPDFLVKVKTKDDKIRVMLIEIKPHKQAIPPLQRKRMTKQYLSEITTWGVNQAKWKAAIEFCKDRQWEFVVMTSMDGISYKLLGENDLNLT